MIIYLNGQFEEEEQASISAVDAGFLFGDGVFTTLRLYQGVAPDLKGHCSRLQEQAQTLGIPCNLTFEKTQGILEELVEKNNLRHTDARMRITCSRGENPEGHSPTILATVLPLSPSFDEEIARGICVVTLDHHYQRHNFPRIKSLNYLPAVMALRLAREKGCEEAIVRDEKNHLTEGAVSNLFLVKDGNLLTPADDGRILAGRTRRHIIQYAHDRNLNCSEKNLSLDQLKNSNEVFLCNSIRQIVPVVQIDQETVGDGKPGPLTLKIRRWYETAMRNNPPLIDP